MHFYIRTLSYLITIFSVLLFTCGELPSDPATDPNNVIATITISDGASGIVQDKLVTIQLVVRYPDLTEKILVSLNNVSDTTLYCNASTSATFDTLFMSRAFKDTGHVVIRADVGLTNGAIKVFYDTITVQPKSLTVTFDTVPQAHCVATGEPDTLVFVASTDPSGGNITCTAAGMISE